MYPYITIRGVKLYMTGIGIVISSMFFIGVVWYLSKRYLQSFWRFFYWLPILISLAYFLGSYTQFVLSTGQIIPMSWTDLLYILAPYQYKFHFVGVLLGILIALFIFFKNIKTLENRKVWTDILFFAFAIALVPFGIFLLLGDNFIGNSTTSFWGMKPLHSESQWNKFDAVHPIGLYLSLSTLVVGIYIHLKGELKKHKGLGALGFAWLLIVINLVIILQQYPRNMVVSMGSIQLDIKQHLSFLLLCFAFIYIEDETQRNFLPNILTPSTVHEVILSQRS